MKIKKVFEKEVKEFFDIINKAYHIEKNRKITEYFKEKQKEVIK